MDYSVSIRFIDPMEIDSEKYGELSFQNVEEALDYIETWYPGHTGFALYFSRDSSVGRATAL